MEPIDVKQRCILTLIKKITKKFLNLVLLTILEYQNAKMFLQKAMLQSSKLALRSFFIIKVKNTVLWTYVIRDLKGEELAGTFYEKELQKIN